jgi:hypothetical protein
MRFINMPLGMFAVGLLLLLPVSAGAACETCDPNEIPCRRAIPCAPSYDTCDIICYFDPCSIQLCRVYVYDACGGDIDGFCMTSCSWYNSCSGAAQDPSNRAGLEWAPQSLNALQLDPLAQSLAGLQASGLSSECPAEQGPDLFLAAAPSNEPQMMCVGPVAVAD